MNGKPRLRNLLLTALIAAFLLGVYWLGSTDDDCTPGYPVTAAPLPCDTNTPAKRDAGNE